jgi:hypothetical protein
MMAADMMTHPVCYALSVMAHINLLLLPLLLDNFLTKSNIMGEFLLQSIVCGRASLYCIRKLTAPC